MDCTDLQQRTLAHLQAAIPAALGMPIVCLTHAMHDDGRLGVTGRILTALAPLGVAEVPLLPPGTVSHARGKVVTQEPKRFQEAVAAALSSFGDVLSQAMEEGRVVLCGWFANAVVSRTELLSEYLEAGLVSTLPYPYRWIQDPESAHAVITQALSGSGYELPAEFPSLAAFSQLLRESKAAALKEWWETLEEAERETILGKRRLTWENMTDAQYTSYCEQRRQGWAGKSPEEMAELGARRSKFWTDLPPERREAIKEKQRLLWREKNLAEKEEHGRKSRERWAALSMEDKKARGDATRAGLAARSAEAKALRNVRISVGHQNRSSEEKECAKKKRLATVAAWSVETKAKVSKKRSEVAKTLNYGAHFQRWRENASPVQLAAKASEHARSLKRWWQNASPEVRAAAASKSALSRINTTALKAEEAAKEKRRALDEGTELSRSKKNWILRAYRKRELQRKAGHLTVPTPVADALARELQPATARSSTKQKMGAIRTAGLVERDAPRLLAALESIPQTKARRLIAEYETRNRQRAQGWDIPATPLSDELATKMKLRSDTRC